MATKMKRKNFSHEETVCLINIWAQDYVQKKLATSQKHHGIYIEVTERMAQMGYNRDWQEIKNKINNLKAEYFRFKPNPDDFTVSPNWPSYFNVLHKVIQNKPNFNDNDNELSTLIKTESQIPSDDGPNQRQHSNNNHHESPFFVESQNIQMQPQLSSNGMLNGQSNTSPCSYDQQRMSNRLLMKRQSSDTNFPDIHSKICNLGVFDNSTQSSNSIQSPNTINDDLDYMNIMSNTSHQIGNRVQQKLEPLSSGNYNNRTTRPFAVRDCSTMGNNNHYQSSIPHQPHNYDSIEMYLLSLADSLRAMDFNEINRVKFEFHKILMDAKYNKSNE